MADYALVSRFYRLFSADVAVGQSLAGQSVSIDNNVVLRIDSGVLMDSVMYQAAAVDSIICGGAINVCFLQGDTSVRFRQEHKVQTLAAQMVNYGYLKKEPVKLFLRDPALPRKRGYWCFGSVSS